MIYCVEDERNIRELLVYTLETTGFEAIGIQEGKELFRCMEKELPDLILLDIMLPGQDGYSILEKLKKDPKTRDIPVIMVTAKEAEYDKVRGLDSGADDYITKPFGMMEFISRVKAVLRRSKKQMKDILLSCGNLSIDVERHQVLDGERQVELTYKEFEMLRYLMENQGIVLTRDKLLEHIWGYDFDGETRTVDVHIRTLRQKLEESGALIETIRGVGYRIGDRK
ncbi:winged helix-turn-helix domain-containing protein [Blautia stercoris]|uniref:winged helix-turn-helix domain-containing protein n=1 Tax=Blautia stercoris TaxID=871664 RepID=UPI00355BBB04